MLSVSFPLIRAREQMPEDVNVPSAGAAVHVTPPTGQAPTETVTDARGHTTALWRYKTASVTHNGADAEITA